MPKTKIALGPALLVAVVASLASTPCFAVKFANQFTEFELPPQWQCNLEGAEWVCQSTNEARKKDAIIVLAAKLKGDQDSLDQYKSYLSQPKNWTSVQGKPVKSEVKTDDYRTLNGQTWVDAIHLESEIPGFYTRYLATVKNDIGVLVTYSVNKNKYQDYVNDFNNMINTLKVFRNPGAINVKPQSANIFAPPPALNEGTVFQGTIAGGADSAPAKPKDNGGLFYLVLGGGLIAFLYWRKKRGGGG